MQGAIHPATLEVGDFLRNDVKQQTFETTGMAAYSASKLLENYLTQEVTSNVIGALGTLATGGAGSAASYAIGKIAGEVVGSIVGGRSEAMDMLGDQYQTALDEGVNKGMSQEDAEWFAYQAMHDSEKYQTIVTAASNMLNDYLFDNMGGWFLSKSAKSRPWGKVLGAGLGAVASNIGEESQEILQDATKNATAGRQQWFTEQGFEEGKSAFWSGLLTAPIRGARQYFDNKAVNAMNGVPNTTLTQDFKSVLGDIKNLGNDIKQYGYQFADSLHTDKDPSYGVHHSDRIKDVEFDTYRAEMVDKLVAAGLSKNRAVDLARTTKLIAMNLEEAVPAKDIFDSAYKIAVDREGNPTTAPQKIFSANGEAQAGAVIRDENGNIVTNWLGQVQRQPLVRTGHYTPETRTAESYGPMQVPVAVHEGMGHHTWTQIENAAANGSPEAQQLVKQAAEGRGFTFEQWYNSYLEDTLNGDGTSDIRKTIQEDAASGFENYLFGRLAPEGMNNQQRAILNNLGDAFYNSPLYHGSPYNMTSPYGLEPNRNMRGVIDALLSGNAGLDARPVEHSTQDTANTTTANTRQTTRTKHEAEQDASKSTSDTEFDTLLRNGLRGLGNKPYSYGQNQQTNTQTEIQHPKTRADRQGATLTQQSNIQTNANEGVKASTQAAQQIEQDIRDAQRVIDAADRYKDAQLKKKSEARKKARKKTPKTPRQIERERLGVRLTRSTPVTRHLERQLGDNGELKLDGHTTLMRKSGEFIVVADDESMAAKKLNTRGVPTGDGARLEYLLSDRPAMLETQLSRLITDKSGMPESVQEASARRDELVERDYELWREGENEYLGKMDVNSTPVGDYVAEKMRHKPYESLRLDEQTAIKYEPNSDQFEIIAKPESKWHDALREFKAYTEKDSDGKQDRAKAPTHYFIGDRNMDSEAVLQQIAQDSQDLPKYVRNRIDRLNNLVNVQEFNDMLDNAEMPEPEYREPVGQKELEQERKAAPVKPQEQPKQGETAIISYKETKTGARKGAPQNFDELKAMLLRQDRPYSLAPNGFRGSNLELIKVDPQGYQLRHGKNNDEWFDGNGNETAGTYRLLLTGNFNGYEQFERNGFIEERELRFRKGKKNPQTLIKQGMEDAFIAWLNENRQPKQVEKGSQNELETPKKPVNLDKIHIRGEGVQSHSTTVFSVKNELSNERGLVGKEPVGQDLGEIGEVRDVSEVSELEARLKEAEYENKKDREIVGGLEQLPSIGGVLEDWKDRERQSRQKVERLRRELQEARYRQDMDEYGYELEDMRESERESTEGRPEVAERPSAERDAGQSERASAAERSEKNAPVSPTGQESVAATNAEGAGKESAPVKRGQGGARSTAESKSLASTQYGSGGARTAQDALKTSDASNHTSVVNKERSRAVYAGLDENSESAGGENGHESGEGAPVKRGPVEGKETVGNNLNVQEAGVGGTSTSSVAKEVGKGTVGATPSQRERKLEVGEGTQPASAASKTKTGSASTGTFTASQAGTTSSGQNNGELSTSLQSNSEITQDATDTTSAEQGTTFGWDTDKSALESVSQYEIYESVSGSDGGFYHTLGETADEKKLARQLEQEVKRGEYVTMYRAVVEIDGKYYSPMATKQDAKTLTKPIELGKWEMADELPMDAEGNLVGAFRKKDGGEWFFRLRKDDGGTVDARYNPYIHTSSSVLNDQFTSASGRPNLRVIEVRVPYSGFKDGYKAYGAKDAVGETDWKSGSVNAALPKDMQRKVILTRYDKPVKVLSDVQVARMIAEHLRQGGIDSIPYNVITPSVRKQLEKQGFSVSELDNVKWARARKAGGFDHIVGGTDLREKIYPQEAGEAYNEYSGSRKIGDLKDFFRDKFLPLFDREDGTRGARVSLGTSVDGKVEVMLYRGRHNNQGYLDHVIVGGRLLNNEQMGFRVAVLSNLKSIVQGAYYVDVTPNDDYERKKSNDDFHSLFFAIKVPANKKYKIGNDGVYIGRLVATESPVQKEGKPLALDLYDIIFEHKYKSPEASLSVVDSTGSPESGWGDLERSMFQSSSSDDGISLYQALDGVNIRKQAIRNEYLTEYTIDGKKRETLEQNDVEKGVGEGGEADSKADTGFEQIIGIQGATRLDELDNSTLRKDSLDVAQQMEANLIDDNKIRAATGWVRGVDDRWRYEIPDGKINKHVKIENPSDVTLTENERTGNMELSLTLDKLYENDELYTAYPALKNMPVVITPLGKGVAGGFGNNKIYLDNLLFKVSKPNRIVVDSVKTACRVLIHEIQHAVQGIEGFALGANVGEIMKQNPYLTHEGAIDLYQRYAGEVEARNVGTRMNMSQKQRAATPLWATEDRERSKQIIEFDGNRGNNQRGFDKIIGETDLREKLYPQEMKEEARRIYDKYDGKNYGRYYHDILESLLGKDENGNPNKSVFLATTYDGRADVYLRRGSIDGSNFIDHIGRSGVPPYVHFTPEEKAARIAVLSNLQNVIPNARCVDVTPNDDPKKKRYSNFYSMFVSVNVPVNRKANVHEDTTWVMQLLGAEATRDVNAYGNKARIYLYDILPVAKVTKSETAPSTVNSATSEQSDGLRHRKRTPLTIQGAISDGSVSLYEVMRNVKVRKHNVLSEYYNDYDIDGEKRDLDSWDGYAWIDGFDQIIGEMGATALSKAQNDPTILNNLQIALEMEKARKNPNAIRLATGWERGGDGKMRLEIPDGNIHGNLEQSNFIENEDGNFKSKLGRLFDAPELYKAYPQLRNVDIILKTTSSSQTEAGHTDRFGDEIVINVRDNGGDKLDLVLNHIKYPKTKKTLLHEIQHIIQVYEGFSKGGSPTSGWINKELLPYTRKFYQKYRDQKPSTIEKYARDFGYDTIDDTVRKEYEEYLAEPMFHETPKQRRERINKMDRQYQEWAGENVYQRLGGEVEARNVAGRMNMTAEERRKALLSDTEDVARNEQINFTHSRDSWQSDNDIGFTQTIGEQGDEQDKKLLELHETGGYQVVLNSKEYQDVINPDTNELVTAVDPATGESRPVGRKSVSEGFDQTTGEQGDQSEQDRFYHIGGKNSRYDKAFVKNYVQSGESEQVGLRAKERAQNPASGEPFYSRWRRNVTQFFKDFTTPYSGLYQKEHGQWNDLNNTAIQHLQEYERESSAAVSLAEQYMRSIIGGAKSGGMNEVQTDLFGKTMYLIDAAFENGLAPDWLVKDLQLAYGEGARDMTQPKKLHLPDGFENSINGQEEFKKILNEFLGYAKKEKFTNLEGKNISVLQAIYNRTEVLGIMNRDYAMAAEELGKYDFDRVINNPAWFHHNVKSFIDLNNAVKADRRTVRTPMGRSYNQARGENSVPYSTNVIDVEMTSFAMKLRDIAAMKALRNIFNVADLSNNLKLRALQAKNGANHGVIQAAQDFLTGKMSKSEQQNFLHRLANVAVGGELPNSARNDREFGRVVHELAQQGFKDLDTAREQKTHFLDAKLDDVKLTPELQKYLEFLSGLEEKPEMPKPKTQAQIDNEKKIPYDEWKQQHDKIRQVIEQTGLGKWLDMSETEQGDLIEQHGIPRKYLTSEYRLPDSYFSGGSVTFHDLIQDGYAKYDPNNSRMIFTLRTCLKSFQIALRVLKYNKI